MGAFQTGFQVGSQIARDALDRREREERAKREEEDRKQQQELRTLQIQGIRDQRDREQRSTDLTTQAVDALLPGFNGVVPAASAVPQPAQPPQTAAAALASLGVSDAQPAAQPAMTPAPAQAMPAAGAAPVAGVLQAAATPPAATYSSEARSLALRIQAAAQAGKDVGPMLGELRTLRETEFEREAFARAKKMTDEQRRELFGEINRGSRLLTAARDKNGFSLLSIVPPDGDGADAVFKRVSDADLYKAAVAKEMLERNPQRALQLFAEVDQRLAAAVAAENNLTSLLATNANDVASKSVAADTSRAAADASRASAAASGSATKERDQTRSDTQALRTALAELERATQEGDNAAIRAARIKVRQAGGTLEQPDNRLGQDVRSAFQAAIKPDQFGRSPDPKSVEALMSSGYGDNWRDIMMGRGVSGAATPAAGAAGAQGGGAGARPRIPLQSITMADIQSTADAQRQPMAKVIENVAKEYGITPQQLRAQLRAGNAQPAPAAAAPRRPPTPQELADDFANIR